MVSPASHSFLQSSHWVDSCGAAGGQETCGYPRKQHGNDHEHEDQPDARQPREIEILYGFPIQ